LLTDTVSASFELASLISLEVPKAVHAFCGAWFEWQGNRFSRVRAPAAIWPPGIQSLCMVSRMKDFLDRRLAQPAWGPSTFWNLLVGGREIGPVVGISFYARISCERCFYNDFRCLNALSWRARESEAASFRHYGAA
jgi:hypothetical protein